MTITKIAEISKSRIQMTIDETFTLVLYKGELRQWHLQEGKELPEEVYREIMEIVLPKRAKLRAMNLLKARPYTERQLTDKLKEGGYPPEIVSEAISYVSSFGYINDLQYAQDYITYQKENKSRTVIFNKLSEKGISKQLIEAAWEEAAGEDEKELESIQIKEWIRKKHFDPETADFKEKQKFCAFLYRKGFKIDSIRSLLSLDITSI